MRVAGVPQPLGVRALRVARTLPVAVDDGNEPRSWRDLRPVLHFLLHLPPAAQAVEPNRRSRPTPQSAKGKIQLLHNPFHERAVAVPVLHENHELLVGEAKSVLGPEFIRCDRMHSNAHASPVRSQRPRTALSRCDEQLLHPASLHAAFTNPRCGFQVVGILRICQVPDVPTVFDLVQNAVQPLMRVRIIGRADVDRDAHTPLTLPSGGAANRQDLFVVLDEDAVRPSLHLAVLVYSDLLCQGTARRFRVDPVDQHMLGR